MKRIAFLGSKAIGFECLQILLQQSNIQITAVLSNDNTRFDATKSVLALAAENNLPILSSVEDLPDDLDVIISVQYHQILKQKHIERARLAVNLHMAPLPEYRGSNQFSYAIIEGKTSFGTTLHIMDAKIDNGDIIAEQRFPIAEDIWIEELYQLTEQASISLFKENIEKIISGKFSTIPQASLVSERGTSLHMRSEVGMLKQIDLNWPAEKIDTHIRATSMPGFEPPYYISNGRKIYFCKDWKN
jgi:methionyl-tRNA formyltransferase